MPEVSFASATFSKTYSNILVAERGASRECPACASEIRGTEDWVGATGLTTGDGVAYGGETDVDWNSQETVYIDLHGSKYPLLVCMDGHVFIHQDILSIGIS